MGKFEPVSDVVIAQLAFEGGLWNMFGGVRNSSKHLTPSLRIIMQSLSTYQYNSKLIL